MFDSRRDDPVLFEALPSWDVADVYGYFDGPSPGPSVAVYRECVAERCLGSVVVRVLSEL